MLNHAEVAVKRKLDGELIFKKLLLIFVYVAFSLLFFAVCFKIKFVQICALLPLFVWMLVFFTWRYTEIEYEYVVSSGELTIATIYGNRVRKTMLEVKINEAERIAPYDDKGKEALERVQIKNVYNILKQRNSPDAYYALFDIPKKGKTLVLFEGDEKALKIMRFYNPRTTLSA